jgi:hypothetical protein
MSTVKPLFCAIVQDETKFTYDSPFVEHYYAENAEAAKWHVIYNLSKQWDMDIDDIESYFSIRIIEVKDIHTLK